MLPEFISNVELDEHLDTNCSYPENSELGANKRETKTNYQTKT
jgi:hypothetical protein